MAVNWQRHSLTWGKRLALVILIMGGVFYGVLSMAERSKDSLRLGLEDYLKGASGHRAEITDLAQASLMPDMIFNIKGVNIRDIKDSKKVYVHVDNAYIAIPFWRVLLGMGNYAALEIKGAQIASGFFLPKKLTVDYAGISDPTPQTAKATFVVEGSYNSLPLLVTMVMDRDMGRKGPLYSIPALSLSTFKLGLLEGDGIYSRRFNGISIEQLHLVRKGQTAKMTVEGLDARPLNARAIGTIDKVPFNATLIQTGETNVLRIIPEVSDRESLLKIENFVNGIKEDFGVAGKDETLTVEIAQPTPKESE